MNKAWALIWIAIGTVAIAILIGLPLAIGIERANDLTPFVVAALWFAGAFIAPKRWLGTSKGADPGAGPPAKKSVPLHLRLKQIGLILLGVGLVINGLGTNSILPRDPAFFTFLGLTICGILTLVAVLVVDDVRPDGVRDE